MHHINSKKIVHFLLEFTGVAHKKTFTTLKNSLHMKNIASNFYIYDTFSLIQNLINALF